MRPRRRKWERNSISKSNREEIDCVGVSRIRLVQDTVRWRAAVDTIVKLRAPGKAGGRGRRGRIC
jgi:hypothetical protein